MLGLCPFHDDKSPSFHVSTKEHVFHCKGCGASGNVIHFHARQLGIEYAEAKMDLADRLGLRKERPLDNALSLLQATAARYHDGLARKPEAKAYLRTRGITDETINRFGIGFCFGDEFAHAGSAAREMAQKGGVLYDSSRTGGLVNLMSRRIVFPIRNRDGQVIAFGGRMMPSDETKTDESKAKMPKYLNTSETDYFKKADVLFGVYEAKMAISKEKFAVVVEGYMDVAVLHQQNVANTVGIMGASVSERAFEWLWKLTNDVVFCLDGDKAGQAGTLRSIMTAAAHMPDGGRIRVMELPEGMDPDEFVLQNGADAFKVRCQGGIALSGYLCREAVSEFNQLSNVEDRAGFIRHMTDVAGKFVHAPNVQAEIVAEAKAITAAKVIEGALKRVDVTASVDEIEDALRMVGAAKKKPEGVRLK